MPDLPVVDWHDQLGEIAQLLGGEGGRACVIGTEASGWRRFAEVARQEIERRCPGCVTIKIDPQSDENTHYRLDIVRVVERKLGLPVLQPAHGTTELLTDLEVGGDLNITDSTITIGHADWEKDDAIEWRRKRIVGAIRDSLANRRVAFLLHRCEAMLDRDAGWFWGDLWGERHEGLQSLTEHGLALICCCQTDARCPHQRRAPAPDFRVRLPSQYSEPDRAAAVDDLTTLVMRARGETLDQARALARYCLESSDYEPEKVYGSLSVLLRWGKR